MLKFFKILTKTILYSIVGVLLLAVLGIVLLRTSPVQTKLAQYFAPIISEKLGYPIRIGKVHLKFFDEVTLESVRVDDPAGFKMINIEKLDVNFKLKNLTDSVNLNLDYARLYHPKIVLVIDKKTGLLNIDEFIRRINVLTAPEIPKKHPKNYRGQLFTIDEAEIVDGIFSFNDQQIEPMNDKKSFDHNHFTFHELNTNIKNFLLIKDTVSLQTVNFRGYDKMSDTRIRKLNTRFLISDTQMRFDDLLLQFNNSVLKNQVYMSFRSQKDFKHWNELVRMRANFDSTVVRSEDLGRFVNDMYGFKGVYHLNGHFDGTVNDFKLKDFELYFGKKSKLNGDFAFKGLPDIPKTVMDLNMKKSYFEVADLEIFIGKDPTAAISKFGHVSFDGTFNGTPSNFKTKGILLSDLGTVDADVTMKLEKNSSKSLYDGKVTLTDFKLGKVLESDEIVGNVDMSGNIIGKGFSVKDAVLNFDGSIRQLIYNGYPYKNIYVDGTLQKELFDGRVAVKDTNLVFDLSGEVDLRNKRDYFDLKGKLSKANLKALKFTDQNLRVQSEMNVQFQGRKLDDIVGRADFLNTYVSLDQRNLILDSLSLLSQRADRQRDIRIRSDLMNAHFSGEFLPTKVIQDLKQLVGEYKLFFLGDSRERDEYYLKKLSLPAQFYKIDYRFNLKNFDPVLALVYPEGHVSKKTVISGDFGIGNTSQFNLNSKIDTLVLGNYKLYNSELDLNTSKYYNNPEVLASLVFNSKNQKFNIFAPTENLELEASWENDKISFTSGLKQMGQSNKANLNGTLKIIQDGLELQFKRSKFRLLDQDWKINPDNLITIIGKEVSSKDLILSNNDQVLSLNGTVSPDSLKSINFKAVNFNLETLAPIISLNLKGQVNAKVDLKDVYKNINIDSDLKLDGFKIDNYLIGNIYGEGIYDEQRQLLNVDYRVERLNNEILTFKGIYDPKKTENTLDMLATLNQTNLEILEPFTKGIFSKFSGTASGGINISGTLRHPIMKGAIDVKKGTLFFDYLKTTLNFEDKISFDTDEIITKNLRVTDEEGNKASLKGGVFYDGDKTFTLSLDANMNRFKILNTLKKDNDVYYGTAYATGRFSIAGPFSALTIDADLRTDRGTRLFIPLDKAQEVEQNEIEFVSESIRKDSTDSQKGKKEEVADGGIKMNFNFNFTPDAYGEVQFDKQTGDIMRVYGNGLINLKIDTKGDFSMTGDYEIDRGDYTFTFQNVLNKKFNIQKGSKISWSGNPYEAMLNIKAAYTQYTSLFPILLDTTNKSNLPEFKRRYPVDVIIALRDRLLHPQISFDLAFRDYPQNSNFNSGVTAFSNKIKTDDQELTRQVSSMLLVGQLISPYNPNAFALSNFVNNLTELLSNQISNLASQLDKNLNIDLSLNGGLNQDLMNNLQLRFSYNFNDRLRITRSGGFTDARNQASAQFLIGDLALEWFITKDGSLRLKTYNRNVQTSILGSLNTYQTSLSQGASLLYTKSFNYFFLPKKKIVQLANPQQTATGGGQESASPSVKVNK